MSKLVTGDGRTHVESSLMRESLQDRGVLGRTDSDHDLQIFPDVALIGIGGQSIFDRGRDALVPLAEEIAGLMKRHRLVIGVGGGTRVRHTASIALDLGLPVGGIAQLVGAMEELNAIMLNALLSRHGAMTMQRDHFWDLPLYLNSGITPICISIPPYHLWEPPPEEGNLPAHGSDFGLFQLADVLAFKQLIYVKDVDGMYDRDPKRDSGARLIPHATLDELTDAEGHLRQHDSVLDKQLFWAWKRARNIKRIQIVNGLVRGQLTAALDGHDAGTVLVKEPPG
jgi:molybdenum storage protein